MESLTESCPLRQPLHITAQQRDLGRQGCPERQRERIRGLTEFFKVKKYNSAKGEGSEISDLT